MGIDGVSIKDAMLNLGISEQQAKELDRLDGEDGKINVDIYTQAKKAKAEGYVNLYKNEGQEVHYREIYKIMTGEELPKEDTPNQKEQAENVQRDNRNVQPNAEFKMKKPPEAIDYDYSNFFVTDKDNAIDEMGKAIKEMLALTAEYNINHYPPLQPDIKEMLPDPAKYTAKKCGNKKEAFRVWQKELERSVEFFKDNIKSMSQANDNMRFNQLINAMSALFVQQGLTRQEIQNVVEQLNGNTQEIKDELNRRAREINGVTKQEGAKTRGTVVADGNLTRYQDAVNTQKVLDEVEYQNVKTRQNIEENKQEELEKENLRKEIALAWHNKPAKLQTKLRQYMKDNGYRYDKDISNVSFLAPVLALLENPELENNSIQSVIENMSLQELREFRKLLKVNEDPLVRD